MFQQKMGMQDATKAIKMKWFPVRENPKKKGMIEVKYDLEFNDKVFQNSTR